MGSFKVSGFDEFEKKLQKIKRNADKLAEIKEGDLYAGWDIARVKDLSVFWLVQKLGDVRITRLTKAFEKTPFRIQKAFLDGIMKLPRLRRMCIDKTGMGIPLEEEAREKYGSFRIEGVTFSGPVKEAMAIDVKNALEDKRCRVPDDAQIRESFHSLRKFVTSAGNTRFDADSTDETGHADHFWAFALAEHAAKSKAGPVKVTSRKRKAAKSITRGFQ